MFCKGRSFYETNDYESDNFAEIHGYDNKFVDIQKELNLKAIQ